MLREEKMKRIKIVTIVLSILLCFNSFADLIIDEYFNNLTPQSHINKLYSEERKNELKGNTINYDDIEDIIHLYNPEVLNNWNSWSNNKSSQDIYDIYQAAADRLFDNSSAQSSEVQEDMMMAQGMAMQIQADKNADDSYTNFLSNYLTEMKLVLSTKLLNINYQKSTFELLNAQNAIEEAKRNMEKAENALKFGNGTQVDYLTAKKAVVDSESALVLAESSQKTYKTKFLLNCGKSSVDDIYIMPINLYDDFDISKIVLKDDYQTALSKNIQYEIYKRKIDNAVTEEVKNEFKILYEAAPAKLYNDLETKYNNIIDIIDTINNRQVSLDLAKDNYKKAQNEYEHGNISNKDLQTAEYNMFTAGNNLYASNFDLFAAIETYLFAVKGFSDC